MNSGKTTALIQAAYNYEERGMKVVLLKPSIDTKGTNTVVSRLGISRQVDIELHHSDSPGTQLRDYLKNHRLDCVLVDEAMKHNFFQLPKSTNFFGSRH
jgi:thymidine kinase